MIKELSEFLCELANFQEIKSIIPGRIRPVKKAVPKITLKSITPTTQGYKALIQSGASVQEVFFVGDSDLIKQILNNFKNK